LARNNSNRKTNRCPVKRATAYKTRKEGQALILKELKWPIIIITLSLSIILLSLVGVDPKIVADIIATNGLVDIGSRFLP